MKILFVGRAKAKGNVSPIVTAQGNSIIKEGHEVNFLPLSDNGLFGYIKNRRKLRAYIKQIKPDIVHAHFSLTGFVASLSTKKPVVVSLMGSFLEKNWRYYLVQFFSSHLWKATIVKSERTANQLKRDDLHIIPNGVNLEMFSVIDKKEARKKCGFEENKKYILFAADPTRSVKNYPLAKAAVDLIAKDDIELVVVHDIPHEKIVDYMSAADVFLLTSVSEGSPNVIKEALACNLPIVTTDVGDVRWLLGGVEGTFIDPTHTPEALSAFLEKAMEIASIKGVERIVELELDNKSVATKLISIYNKLFV